MSQMRDLDLAVDRTSEIPLGTQLIWKLRTLIAVGKLKPGDRLPGLREVAESAGVNINTVRSVFARLEEQSLLSSEHGRGTFVAPEVHAAGILADMAKTALMQARAAGVDPRELAAALYVSPALAPIAPVDAGGERTAPADELSERRALRAEIAALEREVAALDPLGTLDPAPADTDAAAPRVLTAAELSHARDALARRLEQLRGERDRWRIEAQEPEAEEAPQSHPSRWREAGIWTGPPRTRVSWTSA